MTSGQNRCPTKPELVDFLQGRIADEQFNALADHIENCELCGQRLAEAAPTDSLVERLKRIEYIEGQKGPRTSNDPFKLDENFRYELLAELGEGGMGQVFKARHKVMKRVVALKTIRPELINHPEAMARFAKEARAAARLSHPNIVAAFDAEQCGEMHMLVMEYVNGESLFQIVNRCGPLPVDQAIDFAQQTALGLQHAHERKMIHRDIKPHNLMVSEDQVVKILDFGLTKFRRDLESGETDSVADETILTLKNVSMGTEGYIAPEQAADASSVDVRSDIYSLGCTLFFMLTNRPPYFGMPPDDPTAMPDVTRFRKDLPVDLPAVLQKMMAIDPAERFATAELAGQALLNLEGQPDREPLPDSDDLDATTDAPGTATNRRTAAAESVPWLSKAISWALLVATLAVVAVILWLWLR